MPSYWENDLPPAAGAAPMAQAKPMGAAPAPMQQQAQRRPMGQQGAPGGGRWWQNPGGAIRPPMAAPPGGAPPAAPAAPAPAPAAPAPYNAGARFNQPPAAAPAAPAAPAPPPAAGAPPAPAPYNAGARFQQPAAPPPAAAPPAPAQPPPPAQATSLQAAPSEGNASQAWAAAMQGAGRNLAGVDPDRARLDQMSRMDAARNPNASVYGNPGGMDRPDMQQDRVYSTVQDRDPGMSGGGYLRGADAGAGRDRMAQMIERSNFDRRSRAFGPKPPTGVASYGVSPMEESSVQPMEDTPEARTRMEDMQAAYGQQAATAEPPPPPDMGRRAMGMGRGLPPRRRFTI